MVVCYSALFALFALPSVILASEASFSYDPDSPYGPSNWGTLAIDNNQCSGQKNSPIAVTTIPCTVKKDFTLLNGDCTVDDFTFTINNHVVQASFTGNCTKNMLKIPGMTGTYKAVQMHIHTSSEHTIDGEFFGAELHIVHIRTDGDRKTVVGILIEATNSENHEAFESLLNGWTMIADNTTSTCFAANSTNTYAYASSLYGTNRGRKLPQSLSAFNTYNMVPKGSTFYHYHGSLTTPPCSEVVLWNLADIPLSISVSQYNRLANIILGYRDPTNCEYATVASPSGSTSRPTQALNGRVVKRICPSSFVSTAKTSSANVQLANHIIFLLAAAITLHVF